MLLNSVCNKKLVAQRKLIPVAQQKSISIAQRKLTVCNAMQSLQFVSKSIVFVFVESY
jgi:hypothetical protein